LPTPIPSVERKDTRNEDIKYINFKLQKKMYIIYIYKWARNKASLKGTTGAIHYKCTQDDKIILN